MQVDLNRVIEQVSKEKGIDKTIVINAVEEMMHSAARRTFGPDRNIESRFNPELGEIELFEIKTVVEKVANSAAEADVTEARAKYDPEAEVGDEILIKLDTATMGRIASVRPRFTIMFLRSKRCTIPDTTSSLRSLYSLKICMRSASRICWIRFCLAA